MGKDAATLTGRLGGDYPAFYGVARIVASGDWKDLYSPEKQSQSQKGLLPGVAGFLPFAYPPFVAVAMYYDESILLVTYFIFLAKAKDKSLIYGLAFWAFGFAQPLGAFIGFSPLFFLCLSVFILSLHMLSRFVLNNPANRDNASFNNMALEKGQLNTIITEGSKKTKTRS